MSAEKRKKKRAARGAVKSALGAEEAGAGKRGRAGLLFCDSERTLPVSGDGRAEAEEEMEKLRIMLFLNRP